MSELLYSGKVKQVWSTDDPDVIEFRYTDQISVFDQIIPSLIPRKGESLNRSSCHWLKMVEESGICDTHLIEMTAPDRVRARRFEVWILDGRAELRHARELDESPVLCAPRRACRSRSSGLRSGQQLALC